MSPTADGRNANSIHSGYSIGVRLLSYLSAIWCGSVLLVLPMLWITGFSSLIATLYPHLNSTHRFPTLAGALIVVCVGAICDFALGVAFGRFLLRAMPSQPLDRTKGRPLIIIALSVCAPLIGMFILVMFLILIGPDFANLRDLDEDSRFAGLAGGIFFIILWVIGAVGPLILRHGRPRAFLHRPFVLFLRRFSTFSDRTLVALILRQAKAGVPVVFLTPTRSRPKDWNPFLVGFAGLKLRHPLRSVPMVLRARDDNWQRAADELILRAQTILVDASGESAALQAEAEMIEKAERWSDTVHLRYSAPTSGTDRELVGAFENARCIEYSKSWRRALPRLAVSLPIVLFVAFFPTLFVAFFAMELLFVSVKWFLLVIGLVLVVVALISYTIFWGPAVNREAKIELRRVLKAEHPTLLRAQQSGGGRE
jgi:hypothetical protein